MKHPKFNWKTYSADYSELKTGSKMNVGLLSEIRQPKENERIRILCFNSGIRQVKELQNWNAWNGCVYIDVDYKNYLNTHENVDKPAKVFSNVWNYLVDNYSDHFYYGELSRSKKGFHFIFYMETDYPTEERREKLNSFATAAIIKAFTECGYKEAIEYKETKNGVDLHKVLDTCTNSPYQLCYLTGYGKINDKCTGDWNIKNHGLEEIIKGLKNKYNKKSDKDNNHEYIYKSKLLKVNQVQSVPYIEHLVRRNLFKSLSTLFSGDELKREWTKCAKLIPEEHGHTTQYYINAPYKLDWNDSLSENEYCDRDLLRIFGYEVQLISYHKQLSVDDIFSKIYEIINNGK